MNPRNEQGLCAKNPTISEKVGQINDTAVDCLNMAVDIIKKLSGSEDDSNCCRPYQQGLEGTLDNIHDRLENLKSAIATINNRI